MKGWVSTAVQLDPRAGPAPSCKAPSVIAILSLYFNDFRALIRQRHCHHWTRDNGCQIDDAYTTEWTCHDGITNGNTE